MNKKIFMGHPGPYGDIIICAPIAKYYADKGWDVYWPARAEFLSHLERFPYVIPICLPEVRFEMVPGITNRENQNLTDIYLSQKICDGMVGEYLHVGDRFVDGKTPWPSKSDGSVFTGPVDMNLTLSGNESVEEKKYRISRVPFKEKYTLLWERDHKKEMIVYELVKPKDKKNYVFVHNTCSDATVVSLPEKELNYIQDNKLRIVYSRNIENYTIFDWLLVISNATKIYCTESSMQAFVDGAERYVREIPRMLLPMQKGKHTTNHEQGLPTWDRSLM